MSNLSTIEEEIAKLEEEQKNSKKKLALLRKSKNAMLKQAKEDQKSADLKLLDELIESANIKLAKTSIRFEHDQILEAVLVKIDDSHLSEYILTRDLDLKKISKFLDLFSNNVKTIEKIFGLFDDSRDLVRIIYDDQKFKFITFNVFGRDLDINIVSKNDSHLTIKLTDGISYQSDRVSVISNEIKYSFYMSDSYDLFYVDAAVSGKCSVDQFDKTFEHLSKKLAKAEIIEED